MLSFGSHSGPGVCCKAASPARTALNQARSSVSETSRRCATSATDRFCSVISFTAASVYSALSVVRGQGVGELRGLSEHRSLRLHQTGGAHPREGLRGAEAVATTGAAAPGPSGWCGRTSWRTT